MPIAIQIMALALGHVFSNAVRTLPAITADVLSRDLGIGTDTLATITGAFPAAFALAMVPVGVALDRYGSKRTILVLLAVCMAGCAMAALARGPVAMLAAQAVIGIGCSGMLMAPMTFAGRLLSPAAFGLWSGIIQATGNSGMLLSASPLAWLVEASGWRAGYWACGALAGFALAAIALVVREAPPAGPPRAVLADARAVLAFTMQPHLLPCMVLAFASFGAVLGVRGLWGGPWLMEVKGLDRLETGELLLWSATALVLGPFVAGMVARWVGRLVPLGGGGASGGGLVHPGDCRGGGCAVAAAGWGAAGGLRDRGVVPGDVVRDRAVAGDDGGDGAGAVGDEHLLLRRRCGAAGGVGGGGGLGWGGGGVVDLFGGVGAVLKNPLIFADPGTGAIRRGPAGPASLFREASQHGQGVAVR